MTIRFFNRSSFDRPNFRINSETGHFYSLCIYTSFQKSPVILILHKHCNKNIRIIDIFSKTVIGKHQLFIQNNLTSC